MYKKIIALVLSLCILTQAIPLTSFAEKITENTQAEADIIIDEEIIDISSITAVDNKTVNDVLAQYKFSSPQGHGFAAERGNDLADKIKGKNTRVVGDNNIANGPDRKIINRDGTVFIQDKYYADAKSGIDACFDETGAFRYTDGDGNPMQIEVPKDQYDDAVEQMRKKIQEGKLKNAGITDPDEANTLVRKGTLTYNQAKNLAKVGTIESLTYDAANGAVTAAYSCGISAIINYSVCRLSGENKEEALKIAVDEGLKTGVMAFGASVVAGQLSKTGIMKAFVPASEAVVKAFGDDFAKALINSTGNSVLTATNESAAQTITTQAAKALRAQALVAVVEVVVFSVPDAIDMFNGRISKKQFVKNFAVTAVTVVAGTAGGFAGGTLSNLLVPGVGTVPGTIVGSILFGTVGGWATDKIADYITDDDAEEMYVIVQDSFVQKCEDYLVNETEAQNIVDELYGMLDEDMYKDMYQSENREEFIDEILVPLFEQEISKREKMDEPTEEEMREVLKAQLNEVVFIH